MHNIQHDPSAILYTLTIHNIQHDPSAVGRVQGILEAYGSSELDDALKEKYGEGAIEMHSEMGAREDELEVLVAECIEGSVSAKHGGIHPGDRIVQVIRDLIIDKRVCTL
jgi:C-terminal processing protease CtpA/Prc